METGLEMAKNLANYNWYTYSWFNQMLVHHQQSIKTRVCVKEKENLLCYHIIHAVGGHYKAQKLNTQNPAHDLMEKIKLGRKNKYPINLHDIQDDKKAYKEGE